MSRPTVFLFGIAALVLFIGRADALNYINDTINRSSPSAASNHQIQFQLSKTIPPSGKIVLTPQADFFTIPPLLDYSDVDLLVENQNKKLGLAAGSGSDETVGVLIEQGKIIFTLSESDSFEAGDKIIIKIGANATFENQGDTKIINPSTVGSYKIFIATQQSNGQILEEANAIIAVLNKVSVQTAKPTVIIIPPQPPPGGSGGGIPPSPAITAVIFSGKAYPLSKVGVLKDGQLSVTTIAGPDANFMVSLTGLSSGNYIFAVYGEDNQGNRSSLFTFPIYITQGATTQISGIFIAPTIAVDKSEVKRGDNIAIFGQSAPNAEITIGVNSPEEVFLKTKTDKTGIYLYNLDTVSLDLGQHFTRSKAVLGGQISSFGKTIGFKVGAKTVVVPPIRKGLIKADLNNDYRVNLVDFSIVAYWYRRPLSNAFKIIEKEKLSGDGKVDLVDFSIMAYHWTG